jgi:hypothetical protein
VVADLLTVLRDVQNGLEGPSFREVAEIAQELLAKQVRQSWELRQSPDQEAWAPTKRPSYAGVLKASHRHLLGYKRTGEHAFYGVDDLTGNQQDAFVGLKGLREIRQAKVEDDGFATVGKLPKYGLWQSDGTTKTGPGGIGGPIPAREFWGWGQDTLDLVQSLLGERAVAIVQGTK